MKMRIALAVLLTLCMIIPLALGAQEKKPVSAVLEFVDTPTSKQFRVLNAEKNPVSYREGMTLEIGWTVQTGKGDSAEVRLTHNRTIIKISQNTSFTVKDLGNTRDKPNVLAVAAGKIRVVAGKATGDERYKVEGGAAVCGVSGTDFVFDVTSYDEFIYTLEGVVDFYKATSPDKPLKVMKGMMSSFKDFNVAEMTADMVKGITESNAFKKLIPADVPQPAGASLTPDQMVEQAKSDIFDKLKEILGVEIGAITIDGKTYQKLVAQPNFKLGAVKIGLYLPLIYSGNMFDPVDWYKPSGNNEWSFGTDQAGVVDIVTDVVSDTILKIKYLELRDSRNPPFIKIGNLDDITIGHGLIMNDFANDAYFPAIRRVGLNFGMDFGKIGFEYMVNDAANLLTLPMVFADNTYVPDVLTGGRVYFQPLDDGQKHAVKTFSDLAFGVSLLADIGASYGFVDPVQTGEPIFLNPGVDLDVPIYEGKLFSIVAFADAALMVPWLRNDPNLGAIAGINVVNPVTAGLQWQAVYNPEADVGAGEIPFKNYGVAAGLFGKAWVIDWRLEYRYYTGVFKPGFYNSGYEASRSQYVVEVLQYLTDMANPDYNASTMGVYGEGGFKWAKVVSLDIGYFWPWDASGTIAPQDMQDRLIAKFTLEPGVIPVLNISGNVSYERTGFAQTLMGGGSATLFDANTVVKAEIVYPIAPTLDLALFYVTTPMINGVTGEVQYEPGNTWLPKMNTNLTFETRVHF
jgi:hypothetical protein